jgi:ribose/xylose/arabinose/galactoside ABC-type transport system permease subunit
MVKIVKDKELFIGFILIVIFFSLTSKPFLSFTNITNILLTTSISGLLALGLTTVIISGDFDISFGAIAGLLNMVILILLDKGFGLGIVMLFAILAGMFLALINGLLVVKLKIPAFIATLGTMTIWKGVTYWISKGATFYGDYPEYLTIMGRGTVSIFPVSSIIFAFIAFIAILLLNYSKFGRHLYAVGNNKIAAEYVGINSSKIRLTSFLMEGVFIGIAAIILASKLCSGPSTAGDPFLLPIIASVFLGATVFKPGLSNIGGSILGVFLLSVIENGLVMLSVPFYFKYITQGMIIVMAVYFITLRRGDKESTGLSM